MKQFARLLPVAAVGTALVLPNDPGQSSWLSAISKSIHGESSPFDSFLDEIKSDKAAYLDILNAPSDAHDDYLARITETALSDTDHDDHPEPTLNLWEQLKKLDDASKFVEGVEHFPEIVELLKSNDEQFTVFVPTNDAVNSIPKDKEPSEEDYEAVIRHHIARGSYDKKRLIDTYTLPTILADDGIDGASRRLRTRITFHGIEINIHSKVVKKATYATNGVIHFIDRVLLLPPGPYRLMNHLPTVFSTLILAWEKTKFFSYTEELGYVKAGTLFAPTNFAFTRLGIKTNAFLFNTEKGNRYLMALLKYQFIPNVLLYSDSVRNITDGAESVHATGFDSKHYSFGTLLDDKALNVGIKKFGPLRFMKVNNWCVTFQDGLLKRGVFHAVSRLPFPPRKHLGETEETSFIDREMSIEELIERLSPYVDEQDQGLGESLQEAFSQDL